VRSIPLVLFLVSTMGWAQGLSLAQLKERARANDRRVKEAQAQLRVLRGKYDEARFAWVPRIDSYALLAGPVPEARNNGLGGPPTTKATILYDLDLGQPGVTVRAGAEGVLPIFTFGKLEALERAGKKGVEVGEALVTRAKDEAALQVAQAYYGYCLASEARQAIIEALARLSDAKKKLLALREAQSEQVSQADEFRLDYYQRQAEAQLAAADSGKIFAIAAIRLLIGAADNETVLIETRPLDELPGRPLPVDAYLADARKNRPELAAVAAGIVVRENEVLIRERFFLPDFGLAGFFRFAYTTSATRQLSPFAYDPYNDLSAGIGLVAKYTWDFPQKSAQLEQARGELEKLKQQQALLEAGVRLEIERAWADMSGAIFRAEKQKQAERSARRWALAALQAFDVGTSTTRDLIDSFVALGLASAGRSQAYHDGAIGFESLARAIGGDPALNTSPVPATDVPPSR
jgi:outer membrane protein, multidrug efflux system